VALLKSRDSKLEDTNNELPPMLVYVPQRNNSAVAFCHKETDSNMLWRVGLNNCSSGGHQKSTLIVYLRGHTTNTVLDELENVQIDS